MALASFLFIFGAYWYTPFYNRWTHFDSTFSVGLVLGLPAVVLGLLAYFGRTFGTIFAFVIMGLFLVFSFYLFSFSEMNKSFLVPVILITLLYLAGVILVYQSRQRKQVPA